MEQLSLFGDKDQPVDEFLDNLGAGGLEGLAARVHVTAVEKGFWDEPISNELVGLKLALVHSEVTEILEALRKSKGESEVAKEFADVVIRLLDLWAGLKDGRVITDTVDLDEEFAHKMAINENRQKLHGNNF